MVFQGIIGYIQVAPRLKRVWGPPVLISCRIYFRELPKRLLGVSTHYVPLRQLTFVCSLHEVSGVGRELYIC